MKARFTFPRRRALAAIVCSLLALGMTGCGGKVKSVVRGKVTVGTAVMPGGTVIFEPEDGGQGGGTAQIDQDGNYSVTLRAQGPFKIAVVPPTEMSEGARKMLEQHGPPKDAGAPTPTKPSKPVPQIRPIFREIKTTTKKYDVQPGEQEYNIELN